jgi:hypothetical protein
MRLEPTMAPSVARLTRRRPRDQPIIVIGGDCDILAWRVTAA